jgi:hypothetical protein
MKYFQSIKPNEYTTFFLHFEGNLETIKEILNACKTTNEYNDHIQDLVSYYGNDIVNEFLVNFEG